MTDYKKHYRHEDMQEGGNQEGKSDKRVKQNPRHGKGNHYIVHKL
jgi:hypothetical protein